MALVAYHEYDGALDVILLDIIEIPESHTGETLARELEDCLEAFGVAEKVSQYNYSRCYCTHLGSFCSSTGLLAITPVTTTR